MLGRLSQQDEQRVEAQQSLGKQLRSEAQRHGSLVQQLQQMVAERETKVKELEQEIQVLALKVRTCLHKNPTPSEMFHVHIMLFFYLIMFLLCLSHLFYNYF